MRDRPPEQHRGRPVERSTCGTPARAAGWRAAAGRKQRGESGRYSDRPPARGGRLSRHRRSPGRSDRRRCCRPRGSRRHWPTASGFDPDHAPATNHRARLPGLTVRYTIAAPLSLPPLGAGQRDATPSELIERAASRPLPTLRGRRAGHRSLALDGPTRTFERRARLIVTLRRRQHRGGFPDCRPRPQIPGPSSARPARAGTAASRPSEEAQRPCRA